MKGPARHGAYPSLREKSEIVLTDRDIRDLPGSSEGQKMRELEPVSKGKKIYVSEQHRFSTDTILLADFSMPKRNERCADFGTGCGLIPILWAIRSQMKKAYGIEIQKDACALLADSIRLCGFEEKLEVIEGDLRNLQNDDIRELDLISCNPPYKPLGSGIRSKTQEDDLARHEVTLSISDAAKAAAARLRFGGRFCVCQRPERLCEVMEAFREHKIEPKRLRFVQQRSGKAPFLFLLEGKLGAKPFLTVEPVLLIEENGIYSGEMMHIYGDYKNSPIL